MHKTVTVRLGKDLAEWLARVAERSGVSKAKFVRDQLEKVRTTELERPYMRLAGMVHGPQRLSHRKGLGRS